MEALKLQDGFLAADLLKGKFPTLIVAFLEALKAIPGIAHHLACLKNVSQPCCEPEQPKFVLNDLLFGSHLTFPPDFISDSVRLRIR